MPPRRSGIGARGKTSVWTHAHTEVAEVARHREGLPAKEYRRGPLLALDPRAGLGRGQLAAHRAGAEQAPRGSARGAPPPSPPPDLPPPRPGGQHPDDPLGLAMILAPVTDGDLAKLDTLVLWSVWGVTKLSKAKEIVFAVLAPGHPISPVLHVRYERIVSLVWVVMLWGHPGLRAGDLGVRASAPGGRPSRLGTAHAVGPWLPPPGGLVVLGNAGADGAPVLNPGVRARGSVAGVVAWSAAAPRATA